jgi:CRP/FNR family transcriptional regulator, dissimilatory nitrate respiration regulator
METDQWTGADVVDSNGVDGAVLLGKLRLSTFLGQLPGADLAILAASATIERYASSTVLFRQGDAALVFYVISAGHVALSVGDPADLDDVAHIAGPGETIGEACVCGDAVHPMSARLFGAGELIAIPGAALRGLLSQRFETVLAMLGEMSCRLRRQVRQIMDLKMKTAAERLGGYLAGLTDLVDGRAIVTLPYEKRLLASHLGMQPETLSRALMKLQALGVRHHTSMNCFVIRDIQSLRRFADQPTSED